MTSNPLLNVHNYLYNSFICDIYSKGFFGIKPNFFAKNHHTILNLCYVITFFACSTFLADSRLWSSKPNYALLKLKFVSAVDL